MVSTIFNTPLSQAVQLTGGCNRCEAVFCRRHPQLSSSIYLERSIIKMWTLGIDIAKRKHVATLLDDDGKKVFKNFAVMNTMDGVNMLLGKLKETDNSKKNLLIGMEATGHYWMTLYHYLANGGFQVRLINPLNGNPSRNFL